MSTAAGWLGRSWLDEDLPVLRRSITLAERFALRRVVRRLPPPVGTAVTALGQASRGGALWLAVAGVLSLLGRRGRRGAGGGLLAFVLASAVANGPAKWIVRRPRPGGAVLLGLRRRGQAPGTSSFPSSHTASAVAFAVAASIEFPPAAPFLLPAALGVALARLRAVRHYPTDVLAGALLGAVLGAATASLLRRWRGRERADR